MPLNGSEPRRVENSTRVTVAMPFSTIRIISTDDAELIAEMAGLVAGLAAELDAREGDETTADLVARARALVDRLAST